MMCDKAILEKLYKCKPVIFLKRVEEKGRFNQGAKILYKKGKRVYISLFTGFRLISAATLKSKDFSELWVCSSYGWLLEATDFALMQKAQEDINSLAQTLPEFNPEKT